MTHTPTPWAVSQYNDVCGPDGEIINVRGFALSGRPSSRENTAYIVHCVNSHASLVEENKRLREALEGIKAFAATARKSNLLSSPFEDRQRRDIWVKARYEVGKKIYEMARSALGDTNA